jgi:serine/threonine protein kinase
MAPEQLSAGGQVDPRTDVYGLGVVLYELLTGTVPFADPTLTGLRKRILDEDPKPVRSLNNTVPPALEEICKKCLSKEAADRYGSARELATAVRGVGAQNPALRGALSGEVGHGGSPRPWGDGCGHHGPGRQPGGSGAAPLPLQFLVKRHFFLPFSDNQISRSSWVHCQGLTTIRFPIPAA